MCGRPWTDAEIEFLRANYPKHSATWCGKKLGRGRSSVSLKVKSWSMVAGNRPPKVEREDPDLGPAYPPMVNRCVDCGRMTPDYRCPACRAKHISKHRANFCGFDADETYGMAL